ncbi:MAG: caspase family protein [Magnetococcus sp. MYC-9]
MRWIAVLGVGSVLAASGLLSGGEAGAMPAHLRAGGASSVVSAVRMNTRQIFRPTFSIRSRHAGGMTDARFSSDGQWFASASENGAAQLWNRTTGQRELDLRGHAGAVTAVTFIPGAKAARYGDPGQPQTRTAARRDGVLVTAGADGTVRLWSLISGESMRTLQAHEQPVTTLAVTGDGQWLVTGSGDGLAKQWHLPTGRLERSFQAEQGPLRALAIDAQGTRLATGGEDGSLRLWALDAGTPLQRLQEGDGAVLSLAWHRDGQQLASGHTGGGLRLWNLAGGSRALTDHEGDVSGVAFTPDGEQLASVGADRTVRLWSLTDRVPHQRLAGHQQGVRSVAFTPDGRHLLTASEDQTVRFWPTGQAEELARLVTLRSGWAVVTPDGRFDGTLDGELEDRLDAIQWTGDGHAFALDGFLEKYYRPALLGHLLSPKTDRQAAVASEPGTPHVSEGFYLPPKVKIQAPMVSQKSVALQIEAEDQGGGIGETRVYHNDKIVDPGKARNEGAVGGAAGKVEKITYEVELVDGENRFRAVTLSDDRIESEAGDLAITYSSPQPAALPRLHLLVVGVNRYANPALNLNFAAQDAKGMLDFLMRSHATLFEQVVTYELYDQKATRPAIGNSLADLHNVPPQDVVVLYFAGHGKALGDQWYFAPHELRALDGASIRGQALSSEQFKEHIARIGAQKVAVLLDACESGAAMRAFAEFDNRRSMALLSRATGIHLAAATTGEQSASELAELGHGVFTYALLDGLQGKADRQPRDGHVSIAELLNFIQQYVPFLSQKYETTAMTPVVNSRGGDFTVSKQ